MLIPDVRRRFELDDTDEVSGLDMPEGRAWIGLPDRAAKLIEDLIRENRLGAEFTIDLKARLIIGVYAFDLLRQMVGRPLWGMALHSPMPDVTVDNGSDLAESDVNRAVVVASPGPTIAAMLDSRPDPSSSRGTGNGRPGLQQRHFTAPRPAGPVPDVVSRADEPESNSMSTNQGDGRVRFFGNIARVGTPGTRRTPNGRNPSSLGNSAPGEEVKPEVGDRDRTKVSAR